MRFAEHIIERGGITLMKSKVKYTVPIACILIGIYFVVTSFRNYEVYNPTKGPMAGFMPLAVGILLILVALADLIQAGKYQDVILEKENWFFVICVCVTVACNYLIGLLPAGFLFCFLWMRFKSKCSWKETIITLAVLAIVIFSIFVYWLKIPFTYGLLDPLFK